MKETGKTERGGAEVACSCPCWTVYGIRSLFVQLGASAPSRLSLDLLFLALWYCIQSSWMRLSSVPFISPFSHTLHNKDFLFYSFFLFLFIWESEN